MGGSDPDCLRGRAWGLKCSSRKVVSESPLCPLCPELGGLFEDCDRVASQQVNDLPWALARMPWRVLLPERGPEMTILAMLGLQVQLCCLSSGLQHSSGWVWKTHVQLSLQLLAWHVCMCPCVWGGLRLGSGVVLPSLLWEPRKSLIKQESAAKP